MQYNTFAYYYDRFMDDVDYDKWLDDVLKVVKDVFDKDLSNKGYSVLDAACGTGNMSIRIAKKGCDVVGVDISTDMLSVAQQKARNQGVKLKLVEQDISSLDVGDDFNAVFCMCDGVNYLTEKSELENFFQAVHSSLVSGGFFVFDISSEYKLSKVLSDNFFADETADATILWQNSWDDGEKMMQMDLTLFTLTDSDKQLYKKYYETHFQKAHKQSDIIAMLKKCGFSNIGSMDIENNCMPNSQSERIHFFCEKL